LFKVNEEKKFNSQTIICVARLVPIKNLENLLLAWKSVEEHNNIYKLVLLGDGASFNKLKNLVKTLGLNRVEFVGAVPNDNIREHLFRADAFILPSWSESWGLVVNEAMASGLPILLSNQINAADTLLMEGINGYSFCPADANEIKEKIIQFIDLPNYTKKSMSDNSLRIIDSMSYEQMGDGLLEALHLLKSQSRKKSGLLAHLAINLWFGRYNTMGWDSVNI
jgi:glycosyltransferase involved in cell wall biosynthesis